MNKPINHLVLGCTSQTHRTEPSLVLNNKPTEISRFCPNPGHKIDFAASFALKIGHSQNRWIYSY